MDKILFDPFINTGGLFKLQVGRKTHFSGTGPGSQHRSRLYWRCLQVAWGSLQFLSHLEERQLLWLHINTCPCPEILSFICLVFPHRKTSKTSDFYSFSIFQRISKSIEDLIDDVLCLFSVSFSLSARVSIRSNLFMMIVSIKF